MRVFLNQLRKYKVPTRKENHNMLMRIKAGDQDAYQDMIMSNTPLVIHLAKIYRSFLPLEDRIQEGIIGLMTAVERFDISRNVSFSTYAWWWVRQAIQRAGQNNRIIREPVHKSEERRKELEALEKRQFTAEEFWRALKQLDSPSIVSLDYSDEYGRALERKLAGECGSPAEEVIRADLVESIRDIMAKKLDERRQDIVVRRMLGETLEEISHDYNVTRERIRQLEKTAFAALEAPLSNLVAGWYDTKQSSEDVPEDQNVPRSKLSGTSSNIRPVNITAARVAPPDNEPVEELCD